MQLIQTLLQYFVPIQERMANNTNTSTDSTAESPKVQLSEETLLLALTLYCKLFVHATCVENEIEKDSEVLRELISWATDTLVPTLLEGAPNYFANSVTDIVLRVLTECVTFDMCTGLLQGQILNLLQNLMKVKSKYIIKEPATVLR
jgi:hypothetical protein